jgi:hypothetical protein
MRRFALALAALWPLPLFAGTITLLPQQIGQTPSVIGYNMGHFMPGSNAADWWRYSGVKHVRVFMPKTAIEFSDDMGPFGDYVFNQQQFFERRAAMRLNPEKRDLSPSGTPDHLRAPYVNWPYVENRYNNVTVTGHNRFLTGYTFGELRRQGVEILLQLTASLNAFPIADDEDWGGWWELWQHYYFQAYYLAREFDVFRYSMFNEPDHPAANGITPEQWLRRLRFASDAIQSAVADVNRDHGKSLSPRIYAPTTAGATGNPYLNWGRPAVLERRLRIDGQTYPDWVNFQTYSYQVYSFSAATFANQIAELRASLASLIPGEPPMPLALTEFNVRTGTDFDRSSATLDSPDHYTAIGTIGARLAEAGIDEAYLFKFAQTVTQAPDSRYPVIKLGTHYVNNDTGTSINPYGGITQTGEVWRLFNQAAAGGRPRLATTKTSDLGNFDVLATHDPISDTYYVFTVNRGTSGVTVNFDVSALGLAHENRVIIHEVSNRYRGGVRFISRVNQTVIAPPGAIQPGQSVWLTVIPARPQQIMWPEGNPVRSISATADATVRNGGRSNENDGFSPTLRVRNSATNADEREVAVMRFDLSSMDLSQLELAVLTLHAASTTDGVAAQAHVYGLNSASWSESSVTWSTVPQLKPQVPVGPRIEHNVVAGAGTQSWILGQLVADTAGHQEKHIDVTDYLRRLGSAFPAFMVVQEARWDTDSNCEADQVVIGSGDAQAAGINLISRETSLTTGPRLRIVRRIPPPVSALRSWRQENFGNAENSGDAADEADPDGDGWPNLVEFALGGDPWKPEAGLLGSFDLNEQLFLEYTVAKRALGEVAVVAETAASATGPWSSDGVVDQIVAEDPDALRREARVDATGSSRFLRLRVSREP